MPIDEVLRTLLFEVSGILNSRPLTYTSSDPGDFRSLTPSDFLNQASVTDFDIVTSHPIAVKRALRLRLAHQSMTSIRKTPIRNFSVGDLVPDD